MAAPRVTLLITAEPFDAAAETAALQTSGSDVGAVATFVGLCRSEGGILSGLELEHYPGMAEEEISRVIADALARWPLDGVTVIHRHGLMRPGDGIVFVGTASSHRAAAFSACEFLMDYLKTRAPFWKKEHRVDGSTGGWVDAKAEDDAAASRWKSGE
jgi:molybdopterin synthase catalytic subunit